MPVLQGKADALLKLKSKPIQGVELMEWILSGLANYAADRGKCRETIKKCVENIKYDYLQTQDSEKLSPRKLSAWVWDNFLQRLEIATFSSTHQTPNAI